MRDQTSSNYFRWTQLYFLSTRLEPRKLYTVLQACLSVEKLLMPLIHRHKQMLSSASIYFTRVETLQALPQLLKFLSGSLNLPKRLAWR